MQPVRRPNRASNKRFLYTYIYVHVGIYYTYRHIYTFMCVYLVFSSCKHKVGYSTMQAGFADPCLRRNLSNAVYSPKAHHSNVKHDSGMQTHRHYRLLQHVIQANPRRCTQCAHSCAKGPVITRCLATAHETAEDTY